MTSSARRVALALAAVAGVVATALLIGLGLRGTSESPSALPSASALASSSLIPSTEPESSAPPVSSTPVSTPGSVVCNATDEQLAIRLDSFSEIGRHWDFSIYQDGTVLTPGLTPFRPEPDYWIVGRRLMPDGVAQIRTEILATGLFEESRSLGPILLPGKEHPGRGVAGYSITVGAGSEQVVVNWISVSGDDELYYQPSPEREALDQLAPHVVAFEDWLPVEEWQEKAPCGYQAAQFRIFVHAQAWGGSLSDLPADITDVAWPLGGPILDWGNDLELGADPFRCGVVQRPQAADLVTRLLAAGAALLSSPGLDDDRYVALRLGDRSNVRIVDVSVRRMLPGEAGCTIEDHPDSWL